MRLSHCFIDSVCIALLVAGIAAVSTSDPMANVEAEVELSGDATAVQSSPDNSTNVIAVVPPPGPVDHSPDKGTGVAPALGTGSVEPRDSLEQLVTTHSTCQPLRLSTFMKAPMEDLQKFKDSILCINIEELEWLNKDMGGTSPHMQEFLYRLRVVKDLFTADELSGFISRIVQCTVLNRKVKSCFYKTLTEEDVLRLHPSLIFSIVESDVGHAMDAFSASRILPFFNNEASVRKLWSSLIARGQGAGLQVAFLDWISDRRVSPKYQLPWYSLVSFELFSSSQMSLELRQKIFLSGKSLDVYRGMTFAMFQDMMLSLAIKSEGEQQSVGQQVKSLCKVLKHSNMTIGSKSRDPPMRFQTNVRRQIHVSSVSLIAALECLKLQISPITPALFGGASAQRKLEVLLYGSTDNAEFYPFFGMRHLTEIAEFMKGNLYYTDFNKHLMSVAANLRSARTSLGALLPLSERLSPPAIDALVSSLALDPTTAKGEDNAMHTNLMDFLAACKEHLAVSLTKEERSVMDNLLHAMELRTKYIHLSGQYLGFNPKDADKYAICPSQRERSADNTSWVWNWQVCVEHLSNGSGNYDYKLGDEGVYQVYGTKQGQESEPIVHVPSVETFFADYEKLLKLIGHGPTRSFSLTRLDQLEALFEMYQRLNEPNELRELKSIKDRDFYNVRKVDTHIHHSASMTQKHLINFMERKLLHNGSQPVLMHQGKFWTLDEVFHGVGIDVKDLTIDTLGTHSHRDSFNRFDVFDSKYNPAGNSTLRKIFLAYDNDIQGTYLAELTKEIIAHLEYNKYQNLELRITVGKKMEDWTTLAAWFVDNHLFSYNIRWVIQLPRVYNVFKAGRLCNTFEDIIKSIFEPLFSVTKNPASNPKLHLFLQHVIGFDSVNDESLPDTTEFKLPKDWDGPDNPSYKYYIYYLYASLVSLNQYRKRENLPTFVLRPHSGEAGDPNHLAVAFLTSVGISHGIQLNKMPALLYLFYLMRIGIGVAPLSNNVLFLKYSENPFYRYFKIGMNVSLSTDDPLQFHFSRDPLMEEYSMAGHIWRLSSADLCEISRNSVMQCGWELGIKKQWIGPRCMSGGLDANSPEMTNIPPSRARYRHLVWDREYSWITSGGEFSNKEVIIEGMTATVSFFDPHLFDVSITNASAKQDVAAALPYNEEGDDFWPGESLDDAMTLEQY